MASKAVNPNTEKKKLTVTKLDLAKQKPGFTFHGKYLGTSMSQPFNVVDQKTGEVTQKTLTNAIFENDDDGRFAVIQDAGLRSAMTDAMIKENQHIEVVKLEKSSLKGGRTMNQYDIYAL